MNISKAHHHHSIRAVEATAEGKSIFAYDKGGKVATEDVYEERSVYENRPVYKEEPVYEKSPYTNLISEFHKTT